MKQPRIEIAHRPTGYVVRVYGANGEQLSASEVLKTRASARRNIWAQQAAYNDWTLALIRIQFVDERPKKKARKK